MNVAHPSRLLAVPALFLGIVALVSALGARPPAAVEVLAVLKGHTDTIDAVAVSPDGKLIATGSFDKSVRLWDAETGKPGKVFAGPQGHQGQVLAVGFSPKGELLASGGADNTAKVWDVAAADKPVKNLPHPNLVDAVAFDPTGTLLATGCHDGLLRVFDVQKGAVTKTITAHVQTTPQNVPHPIYCVLWAPGGKQLLTASYDRSLKLWDAAGGTLVREFKAAPDPKPGDKPEPAKGPVGHRDQVFSAAFSADGKLLATVSSDRTVKLWDVNSGKVLRDFPNPDLPAAFPGEPAPSHPGWVHGVTFTPDGKHLVTGGAAPRYRGYLAVWSVENGKRVAGGEQEFGPVQALALLPDGDRLVLGCGVRSRDGSAADALIVKLPTKEDK